MPLPRAVARANRVGLNRVFRHQAPHLPGFGVVEHRGRRSGRLYKTPVNVFAKAGGFVVALTYGAESQWVRNVLAAGRAVIVTGGPGIRSWRRASSATRRDTTCRRRSGQEEGAGGQPSELV